MQRGSDQRKGLSWGNRSDGVRDMQENVRKASEAKQQMEARENIAYGNQTVDTVGAVPHEHILEDGTVVSHTHPHSHTHTHQNTKAVINRLSRAIGHLEKVRSMVENGEDCSEVLIQLSAVKAAINNTGKLILKDHIEHCIVDAIACGDLEAVEDLTKAIDQFVK